MKFSSLQDSVKEQARRWHGRLDSSYCGKKNLNIVLPPENFQRLKLSKDIKDDKKNHPIHGFLIN